MASPRRAIPLNGFASGLRALAACGIMLAIGCERPVGPAPQGATAPQPAPAPPPPPAPVVDLPAPGPRGPATTDVASPSATPPAAVSDPSDFVPGASPPSAPPSGPPTDSASRVEKPVKLSAGVALAQTLPGGTAMLFSIDYRFEQGRPRESFKYYLTVLSKARPLRLPVRLQDRGTLVPPPATGLRPEHGPFRAYLSEVRSDGSERVVSETLTLR